MKQWYQLEIIEQRKIGDKLLVVKGLPCYDSTEAFLHNVYCYSADTKKLMWRISNPPNSIAGTERIPYVGLSITDQGYGAVDFWGRRFFFDIDTGDILGVDFVK